jgi:hypothetical protein
MVTKKAPSSLAPKPALSSADQLTYADLDRRLTVVRDRVRGVARGHHTGFYLFGRPGTSKTYTVKTTLDDLGVPYSYHDGHLTPMGLFDLLEEQQDRVIVLDDVSAIFEQRIALQLLLAALGNQPDETGERVVKYRRQGRDATIHFTGGVICISNLELHGSPLLNALKSRVHYLEYDPPDEQMAALMRVISAKGWPSMSPVIAPDDCLEITEFLISESKKLDVRLDIRHLIDKAFPDYIQYRSGDAETHWKDLIRTTLEEQLLDLKHTPAKPRSRQDQKDLEQQIVREIVGTFATIEVRLAAWDERTGKSSRAFYRRLKEIGM